MQAELAFVQARLSTLQRLPATYPAVDHQTPTTPCCLDQISASSGINTSTTNAVTSSMPLFDNFALHSQPTLSSLAAAPPVTAAELASYCNISDYQQFQHHDLIFEDGDLQTLTREFVSKYLPGVKFKSEPN